MYILFFFWAGNLLNVRSNKSQMCFAVKVSLLVIVVDISLNFFAFCSCYGYCCFWSNLWHQIYCVNSHV